MSGVAVWRFDDPEGGFDQFWHNPGENDEGEPGQWHPQAYDDARERVVEAAQALRTVLESHDLTKLADDEITGVVLAIRVFKKSLRALDAAG